MVPETAVSAMRRISQSLSTAHGTVPLSLLFSRTSRRSSLPSPERSAGTVPLSSASRISRRRSLLSEKSELGSVPERQDEQGVATERSSSTRGHGQE